MQNTDKGTASQDVFLGKVSVEVEHGALTADNKQHTYMLPIGKKKVKKSIRQIQRKGERGD
jgi:hypothetical protein